MQCFRNVRRKLFNATSLNSNTSLATPVQKHQDEVKIVIIGAGLAGLSAANHLIKNGFRRTVLLEATDRYGGRINSKKFGDAFCELGAKWIAVDSSKDSMYEVLQSIPGVQKKIHLKNSVNYVDSSGRKVNQHIPNAVDAMFHKVCASIPINEKLKSGRMYDLNSVSTYFEAEAEKITQTYFKENERSLADDVFNILFKEFSSLLGCCLEYVNIEHITKLNTLHKASPIYIPSGLDTILHHISSNILSENVRIGKPVGEIIWNGSSRREGNSVGCLDGSAFAADHIICTLPLGVLKNFSTHMFQPNLPHNKKLAIQNIGFGSPIKIYFEYKDNIKPWFAKNIRPLWCRQERKRDLKWIKQVVEISKLPTSSHVLEIQIGGAFYETIEKLPDVEILDEVTLLIRKCMMNPTIPYPTALLRSNWTSSACYLGGRPYFSTESNYSDVNTLAAPLGEIPSLLFAGDATILYGFGTVDGARMSGIREAQRIINFYQQRS